MYALVADRSSRDGFTVGRAPVPRPRDSEALVDVRASSVNPADLSFIQGASDGAVLGYELAGVVRQAAADGSGPAAGERVAGMVMGGAWAETAAVPVAQLGKLPAGLDVEEAATLPISAVSALRALRSAGPVLGRRVMVTGASGSVGAFATQLGAIGGASEVIAVARDPQAGQRLLGLGATEVVTSPTAARGLVDTVIENVGGTTLTEAFGQLAAGGTLVSVGRASGADIVLSAEDLQGDGGRAGRSVRTFFMPDESPDFVADLEYVLRLAAARSLRTRVEHREEMLGDLSRLRAGAWPGKLVLTLPPTRSRP